MSNRSSCALSSAFSALALGFAIAASPAVALQPARFDEFIGIIGHAEANQFGANILAPQQLNLIYSFPPAATSFSGLVATHSNGELLAHASQTGPDGNLSSAGGIVHQVEIQGPPTAALIPVVIQASGAAASVTGEAVAIGTLRIAAGTSIPVIDETLVARPVFSGGPTSDWLIVNGTYALSANTPYTVSIGANVAVSSTASQIPGTGYVYMDPRFSIDASFPDASFYTVALSPGITTNVPEPDRHALLAAGVVLVAGVGSARRSRSCARRREEAGGHRRPGRDFARHASTMRQFTTRLRSRGTGRNGLSTPGLP